MKPEKRLTAIRSFNTPQTLTIDLGKVCKVSAFRVFPAWSIDNRYFPRITQFVVKTGVDGKNYQTVMDESRNIMPDTAKGVFRKIAPVQDIIESP